MDIQPLHNILIMLHATAAAISFFVGCLLIFAPAYTSNQRLFGLYWWSLIQYLLQI
jgi:hypothetical protein